MLKVHLNMPMIVSSQNIQPRVQTLALHWHYHDNVNIQPTKKFKYFIIFGQNSLEKYQRLCCSTPSTATSQQMQEYELSIRDEMGLIYLRFSRIMKMSGVIPSIYHIFVDIGACNLDIFTCQAIIFNVFNNSFT